MYVRLLWPLFQAAQKDQDTYEKDTVRVPFINSKNLEKFLKLYAKLL